MFENTNENTIREYDYGFVLDFLTSLNCSVLASSNKTYKFKNSLLSIEFKSENPTYCNFELGFRLDEDRRINLFIGEFGGVLLHFEEFDDEEIILKALLAFMVSEVYEYKTFCGEKLKEVSYLCSEITYPLSDSMLRFTPYKKSFLFCFKQNKIQKKYEPWVL